ncbi:hypothetical protein ROA7450_01565 [Roseovarius albus]|uniref:Uncharacterized protein n=1 Tax=Roseovarius albus TaxID=1247867 RepID=A0A1X6YY74_9RHOB|nr:hypothetical protein [Roseovarius albus]SLN34543.1 hypothetical protein ROA7450_01565 [Roseovarius albus]
MSSSDFPWNGNLTKGSHKEKYPEMWASVTSYDDYTKIEEYVLTHMRNVMEEGDFLQSMSRHVIENYEKIPDLRDELLKDSKLTAEAFETGDKPDLYNLERYSVTHRATDYLIAHKQRNPLHDILKTTEFFIDHVKAAVTIHYLNEIGFELEPIKLDEKMNYDRST